MKPIGQYWEQRAEHFLMQHGLQLITRNFSTPSGEIGLIMRDGNYVAFIKVRCRTVRQPTSGVVIPPLSPRCDRL